MSSNTVWSYYRTALESVHKIKRDVIEDHDTIEEDQHTFEKLMLKAPPQHYLDQFNLTAEQWVNERYGKYRDETDSGQDHLGDRQQGC